jgi:hypothetical protein
MTTPTTATTATATALVAAASLIAAAALVNATGVTDVSITVDGADISIQIPLDTGDEPTRAATIAAYARVLSAPVHRHTTATHTWIRAAGVIGTHPVRVWTTADPAPATAREVA